MPLFEKEISEVVTPQDIKTFTGIRYTDFGLKDEAELEEMLSTWAKNIGSHVYARIRRQIKADDPEYEAIQDVIIRTVAKLIATAQQQRTSPIIQIGDFAIGILNTSDVIKDLGTELKPFLKSNVGFFSS